MSNCELNEEGYQQEYPVFTAKEISKIDNGKGRWKYLNIGVFQQDSKDEEPKQIGEYKRNYSTLYRTFAPTRKGDKFYALYSPDYTATRVLEITPGVGIKDIGGEDCDSNGFCPVEFHIPTLRAWASEDDYGKSPDFKDWSKVLDYFPPGSRIEKFSSSVSRQKLVYSDGKDIRAFTGEICKHTNREQYKWVWGPERLREYGFILLPPQHAFVAGCYWGDDTSWKIHYIDVSRIDEGIIKRDNRFGYIELPTNMELKDAIVMRDHDEQPNRVRIAIEVDYEIDSGALVDWNDLGDQIAKGKVILDKQEAARKRWSDNFNTNFAEMQARWKEQGERILREVAESGGKIQ